MSFILQRRSPLEELVESRARRSDPLPYSEAIETGCRTEAAVWLCDVSDLVQRGLKGPAAADWLRERQLPVPADVYRCEPIDAGGRVIRVDRDEFLIESHDAIGEFAADWGSLDGRQEGVTRIERHDATFLLTGIRAANVLAQTCGVDFHDPRLDHWVLTRVAGVSVGILPWASQGTTFFQCSVDPTYARYLWEELREIVDEVLRRG